MVPILQDRKTLTSYWKSKVGKPGGLADYLQQNNAHSLDGLPGLRLTRRRGALAEYGVLARSALLRLNALAVGCFAVGVAVGVSVAVGMAVLRPVERFQALPLL